MCVLSTDPGTACLSGLGSFVFVGEVKREFIFNQVSLLPGLSNEGRMSINLKLTNFHNTMETILVLR